MGENRKKLAELHEMKKDVSRALVDIWRGARLVRNGVDVTEEHKSYLQAVVLDIGDRIAVHEGCGPIQLH